MDFTNLVKGLKEMVWWSTKIDSNQIRVLLNNGDLSIGYVSGRIWTVLYRYCREIILKSKQIVMIQPEKYNL